MYDQLEYKIDSLLRQVSECNERTARIEERVRNITELQEKQNGKVERNVEKIIALETAHQELQSTRGQWRGALLTFLVGASMMAAGYIFGIR
jgi:predicted  nucleic acid-binding Zn-ribbon protein